jgi:hypothetical protein
MLQVIKLILTDKSEVVQKKVQSFMKFQNKDLQDELSIPNQISGCEFFEVEISEESSLIVNCKGDCSLYFEILDKSGVNYKIEDMTSLYFRNELIKFIPESEFDNFNKFLYNSLSIDDVLDKISQSGIDSLNQLEKMVLCRI